VAAHRKCNHNGPRFSSNGACKQCHNERRKLRRRADKDAVNAYNRSRYAKNPERANNYGKKYRKSAAGAAWYARTRSYYLWKRAKHRAESLRREFTVTAEQIKGLILFTTHCPHTGVALNFEPAKGFKRNPWGPSIDRIDSAKGYTLDNIEVTSLWWNLAKNEWTPEVMEIALAGLRTHKT
jgi:hypothetical protein